MTHTFSVSSSLYISASSFLRQQDLRLHRLCFFALLVAFLFFDGFDLDFDLVIDELLAFFGFIAFLCVSLTSFRKVNSKCLAEYLRITYISWTSIYYSESPMMSKSRRKLKKKKPIQGR